MGSDLPIARNVELYTLRSLEALLLWLSEASLLVNVDLLTVLGLLVLLGRLGTAQSLFFVDADFLLDVRVAAVGSTDGGREGCVGFFVTFPSV